MTSNYTKICTSTDATLAIITNLLKASRWFQVDPWPEFRFEITVHSDAAGLLKKLIRDEEEKT